MSNIREAELMQMLAGILGRRSPPRRIAGDENAEKEEMATLFRALSKCAPSSGYREWFSGFSDALASRAKTRAWPIVFEIEAAANSLSDRANSRFAGDDTSTEAAAIETMTGWFRKFRSQMPGMGRDSRTAQLIQKGVLKDEREARFYGFSISEDDRRRALLQPIGKEEWRHHISVLARLHNLSEVDAEILERSRSNEEQMPTIPTKPMRTFE